MKMRITKGNPVKAGAHRKESIVTAAGRGRQRLLLAKTKERRSEPAVQKLPLVVAPFSWSETISGERAPELNRLMNLPDL